MAKSFHIGAILSVTGKALMCPIGDVYEILNYMTDDNLFHSSASACCPRMSPGVAQTATAAFRMGG